RAQRSPTPFRRHRTDKVEMTGGSYLHLHIAEAGRRPLKHEIHGTEGALPSLRDDDLGLTTNFIEPGEPIRIGDLISRGRLCALDVVVIPVAHHHEIRVLLDATA